MFNDSTHFMLRTFSLLLASLVFAAVVQAKPLPASMTGAIILKLMALEADADESKDLNILVINDPNLANYLLTKTGTKIGQRRLAKVWFDSAPVNATPNVIYINSNRQISNTVAYAQELHALTISSDRSQADAGIVLFIYDDEGLPGISINISASKTMGYKWNPKILDIAEAIQ